MDRTRIKKIIVTAIVLTIVAMVVLTFAACHRHTYSNEWSHDETSHWHESTCGHGNTDQGLHEFGDWQVITPATELDDGLQQRLCKVCGYTESETIPHTHNHSYADEWSHDETSHWHESTCGHGNTDQGLHEFGDWQVIKPATELDDGLQQRLCKECGYTESETIPHTHNHSYADEWSHDETSHWHESTCGHGNADQALHQFGDWQIITPATELDDGLQQRKCEECGYTESETIPSTHIHSYSNKWSSDETSHWHDANCGHTVTSDKADHIFTLVEEEPSTCQVTGVASHYICEVCNKLFDINKQSCETDDLILPVKEHKLVLIPGVPSDCENEGLTDGYYCEYCKQTIVKQEKMGRRHLFMGEYYLDDLRASPYYEDRAEFEHYDNSHITCQQFGYAGIKCELCETTILIRIIGAHEYEDGSDVCKNCGQKKDAEETAALLEAPKSAKRPVIALPSNRKQTLSDFQ